MEEITLAPHFCTYLVCNLIMVAPLLLHFSAMKIRVTVVSGLILYLSCA